MEEARACWSKLIDYVVSRKYVIFYGEAGTGKTSLVLSIIKHLGEAFVYFNTEYDVNFERVVQVLGLNCNGLFIRVYDMSDLIFYIIKALASHKPVIVVDSLNALYRHEAGINLSVSTKKFAFLNAILKYYSKEKLVLCTAQVSGEEEEPSGMEVISFYANSLVKLEKEDNLYRKLKIDEKETIVFRISNDGVEVIECMES